MEDCLTPRLKSRVEAEVQFWKRITLNFLVYISGGEAFGCETGGGSEGLDPVSARTEG